MPTSPRFSVASTVSSLLCYMVTGQDTLDYSNHTFWPNLLYAVAFLHTVVQVQKPSFYTMTNDSRKGRSSVLLDGTSHMRFQIAKYICLLLLNVNVTNCKAYLSFIAKCICFILQNVFYLHLIYI